MQVTHIFIGWQSANDYLPIAIHQPVSLSDPVKVVQSTENPVLLVDNIDTAPLLSAPKCVPDKLNSVLNAIGYTTVSIWLSYPHCLLANGHPI